MIFLLLYARGLRPGAFAWPAGAGDILVGLLAPVIAFGILDLILAVGMGFATSPSPFQFAAFAHPNEIISLFPLVLIPTFLVPLSILLHLASLAKLRRARAGNHKLGAAPALV